MPRMIQPGTSIFWMRCEESGEAVAITAAQTFCKVRSLTADDVRIVKRPKDGWGEMIEVEAKRECRIVIDHDAAREAAT